MVNVRQAARAACVILRVASCTAAPPLRAMRLQPTLALLGNLPGRVALRLAAGNWRLAAGQRRAATGSPARRLPQRADCPRAVRRTHPALVPRRWINTAQLSPGKTGKPETKFHAGHLSNQTNCSARTPSCSGQAAGSVN